MSHNVGVRPKAWYLDPAGDRWLRKTPRSPQTTPWLVTEIVTEALSLELGRHLGLDVSTGSACIWNENGATVRGFISKKFHADSESHLPGIDLIAGPVDVADERQLRVALTFDIVERTIDTLSVRYGVDLRSPFLKMLLFDAWIGNTDRHTENWGVVTGGAARLAPIFDTAACLGSRLHPRHPLLDNPSEAAIAQYADGCTAAFGNGIDRWSIPQAEVLRRLQGWPEWDGIAPPLIARIASSSNDVDRIVSEIPDEWFAPERQRLARSLLVARGNILARL